MVKVFKYGAKDESKLTMLPDGLLETEDDTIFDEYKKILTFSKELSREEERQAGLEFIGSRRRCE